MTRRESDFFLPEDIPDSSAIDAIPTRADDARQQSIFILVYQLLEQIRSGLHQWRLTYFHTESRPPKVSERGKIFHQTTREHTPVNFQVVSHNICDSLRVRCRSRATAKDTIVHRRQLIRDAVGHVST